MECLARILLVVLVLTMYSMLGECKKSPDESKPAWAKKNIRDYTDADLERLYDQWEEDDDPLEQDELPEHLRPQQQIDMNTLDFSNPENLLKMSKRGKTVMSFVTVAGNPTREKTEEVTKLWQSSLWNNHIQAERFLVSDTRAIFMFKEGSQSWEAKDFLITQEDCEEVVIENKSYFGKNFKHKEEKAKEEL